MAGKDLNRRLTTLDASFLYFEKPKEPLHIGGCMIYDGYVSRDDVIRLLSERLHLVPRYRQKVVFPPFGLAHPTWEDDPDFAVHNHVEELILPKPGDDQVLSIFGGQVYASMLDRDRPLWKMIVLQGRPDGNTAVIWKIHHAMVDGVSGVELTMVLHDLKPHPESPSSPPPSWQPKPIPDALTLLQDAVRERLTEAAHTWTDESFLFMRPKDMTMRAQHMITAATASLPALLQPAPQVPFNGPLSGERQFAWVEFSFAEIRAIRSVLGGTVNDVVLTVIAGGLSHYLRAHGYQTDGMELRAMCPVSMRLTDERGALGNLVSMMLAPLYVGIIDPIERLAAERGAMEKLKDQDQAGGLYAMTTLVNRIPPVWQALAGQFTVPNLLLNTVSTNVPGPQIPLYLGGHKLLAWYPLGITSANLGLFNAILSYNQKLTIGATVDPQLMPDVWFYVESLQKSLAELRMATERRAAATPSSSRVSKTTPVRTAARRKARGNSEKPASSHAQ